MFSALTPRTRRWILHSYRVGVFVFLVVMIHRQHGWYGAQRRGEAKEPVTVEQVLPFYPKAARLSDWDPSHGGQNVYDAEDKALGYVIQTSPEADRVVGFSGPTNMLVALDKEHHILGTAVLRSDDTKEHLGEVLKNKGFFTQWNGLGKEEAAAGPEVYAVSGATLTSEAIADSIAPSNATNANCHGNDGSAGCSPNSQSGRAIIITPPRHRTIANSTRASSFSCSQIAANTAVNSGAVWWITVASASGRCTTAA